MHVLFADKVSDSLDKQPRTGLTSAVTRYGHDDTPNGLFSTYPNMPDETTERRVV
jgi:hypothetical protein